MNAVPVAPLTEPRSAEQVAGLRLRLLAVPTLPLGSVERVDQRTSLNDARAALSIACGADPNDVHPVLGTWGGFR